MESEEEKQQEANRWKFQTKFDSYVFTFIGGMFVVRLDEEEVLYIAEKHNIDDLIEETLQITENCTLVKIY